MIVSEKRIIANRLNAKLAGRPKSSPTASDLEYKKAVTAYLAKRIADEIEPIVDGLIVEAKQGNVMAFVALLDRAYGKVPQGIVPTDQDGTPIVFMPSALIEKYSLPTQDTSIVNSTELTHEMVNVKKIDNGLVEPLKEK